MYSILDAVIVWMELWLIAALLLVLSKFLYEKLKKRSRKTED